MQHWGRCLGETFDEPSVVAEQGLGVVGIETQLDKVRGSEAEGVDAVEGDLGVAVAIAFDAVLGDFGELTRQQLDGVLGEAFEVGQGEKTGSGVRVVVVNGQHFERDLEFVERCGESIGAFDDGIGAPELAAFAERLAHTGVLGADEANLVFGDLPEPLELFIGLEGKIQTFDFRSDEHGASEGKDQIDAFARFPGDFALMRDGLGFGGAVIDEPIGELTPLEGMERGVSDQEFVVREERTDARLVLSVGTL